MNAMITLYLVRDKAGRPIAGPYAVETDALFAASIIHTARPPSHVTAHDIPALVSLDPPA